MSTGIFYSVGVGPGDSALLTFKAAQTIAGCDVIAAPDSGGAANLALKIAAEHIQNKPVITCPMPMTRDAAELARSHQQAEEQMREVLDQGLNVAFLTLGDPSVYSTAMYVHQRLSAAGYQTVMIPGVPSFCAAAASLNTPLAEGAEPLHILPACYGGKYAELNGVKVLMKSGQRLAEVLEQLREQPVGKIMLVERASMADERVYRSLAEIPDEAGYFSLLVVKPAQPEPLAELSTAKTGEPPQKEFFPLFISSQNKKALVVGGGNIALRRINALRQFAFNITVVAPKALAEIAALHQQNQLTYYQREFRDEDLEGCFLAVAATDNRGINRHVGELAAANNIWASVADSRAECGFLFPAVAVNEQIVAGLTSEGHNHAATREAARRVREVLNR